MKKGFTLIELLIVMVVVGVLVTVALPKYRSSMERARAVEAINNLRAASDAANARYVIDGNTYVKDNIYDESTDTLRGGNFTKSVHFIEPSWYTGDASSVIMHTSDLAGTYELYAVNQNGELKYISCSGEQEACLNAGMEEASFTDPHSNSNLIMDFQ